MHDFPSWVPRVDRDLARVAAGVRVLGAATPREAARERARLAVALESGGDARPRWTYGRASASGHAVDALEAAVREIEAIDASDLQRAYAARARELLLEARIAAAVGTPAFAALARERFTACDAETASAASRLAARWIAARPTARASMNVASDDASDPRSLLCCMQREIGRLKLPFAVEPHRSLAALAATGDRVVLVAKGRDLSEEDVRRTVLHEVHGHVSPRARATSMPIALFAIGTARGADDQEGWALVLEERAGCLDALRRRQLAARHVAVETMLGGATFAEVARALVRDHAFAARDAVTACERAFRGGDGESGGLGRERVYLEAFIRVRAHLERVPGDEATLASGQVAVEEIGALGAFTGPR